MASQLRSGCTGLGEHMKAIVRSEYGSPDVLTLAEVAKPVPAADEVLVQVRASSVGMADVDCLPGCQGLRCRRDRR